MVFSCLFTYFVKVPYRLWLGPHRAAWISSVRFEFQIRRSLTLPGDELPLVRFDSPGERPHWHVACPNLAFLEIESATLGFASQMAGELKSSFYRIGHFIKLSSIDCLTLIASPNASNKVKIIKEIGHPWVASLFAKEKSR
jgi:hypothetical protein